MLPSRSERPDAIVKSCQLAAMYAHALACLALLLSAVLVLLLSFLSVALAALALFAVLDAAPRRTRSCSSSLPLLLHLLLSPSKA